jgi:outer membrane protein OmpA-like peptidoglycan-associated protein/septum formation topological specificity factor MinE
LEQASAAVVKLRWAQTRRDQANTVSQAAMQAELLEAQQRQWKAEQDTVSLRQELSQANGMAAGLQAQVVSAQGGASDAQESLAAVRQTLAEARSALAQEQGRYRVVAQVLSSTQQRLGEANVLSVQLRAELDNVGRAAAVRQGMLASVQQQLRDAQTSMVQGQDREAALQQDLSQTQQRLSRAEAESAQLQGAQQVLARLQDELAGTQSALAEEQERHRTSRGILAGVRQALEQASAAVVKLRWAQTRRNQANAVSQAAMQAELLEAQQRQWQAEQDTVSLRQELSQANATATGLQAKVASVQGEASDAQEALVAVRQKLADLRAALAEERSRYGATAQVLSSTQQALAESQLELGGVSRAAAVRQGMLASVQQQLRDAQTSMVQDQERQAGLEQTLAQTQQDLAQANSAAEQAQGEIVRQARISQVRQSQMNRDLMEARAQGEAVQLILASVREELARTRRTLEQEQGRSAVQGEVLANTQAALAETSASLVEVRAAMAEQTEAHASSQAAAQSDKQQWVERYWDMEQQRNKTRQAMNRAEQAYAETQQALDQTTRQARIDEIRQSQLRRDLTEARQVLDLRNARRAEAAAGVEAVADLMRQRFADEFRQKQLSVREGKRRVKLASAEVFDFVKAVELGSRSVRTLDRLAAILQELPSHQVRFEVHTDNIPLRQGSRWPTNWELSTARAAKLARYLIDKGVAPERLSIGGYGEYRPVADNSTPEGRQQNRRVEVIIKPPRKR